MTDFADQFKRRESSEGSFADDDDEYQNQFAREEINHHSDDEDRPQQSRPKASHRQPQRQEERKQIVVNQKRREEETVQKQLDENRDNNLNQGEEKQDEGDSGEHEQDQDQKGQKKDKIKGEKKDPTFVPKGSFYQHDTRGEDVEFTQKKNSDKLNKYRWKHDKFERNYNENNQGYNNNYRSNRDYGKRDNYEKNPQVYYVPKGEREQKHSEEQPRGGTHNYKERSSNNNYSYNNRGGYNKDYNKDRGYQKNKGADVYEYVKKDGNKVAEDAGTGERDRAGSKHAAGKKDYYVEYVPKTQENK